jgi:hypothetical protein
LEKGPTIPEMLQSPLAFFSYLSRLSATLIHSRFAEFPLPAPAEAFHIRAFVQAHLRPKIDSNAVAQRHIGGSPRIAS